MKLPRVAGADLNFALRKILEALDNGLTVTENFKDAIIHLTDRDSGPHIQAREGSPEGVVSAGVGSLCVDYLNGEVYVKQGTGNTGWKLITHA